MTPTKILQCVYSMNYGGVEVWLMHVLRKIDRTRYQIDFVTFSGRPGDFDDEIRLLGSRIFPCAKPSRPWRHAREFQSILERCGPYDVVHSHDSTWNGSVLAIAKRMGVPIRIAHSHNDLLQSLPSGFFKRTYTKWSIRKSKQCATDGLACSPLAASSYFGERWRADPRWSVFYCGEDFSPFAEDVDSHALRKSLGLPEEGKVVGHLGSFRDVRKNHAFIIEVARKVVERERNAYFLLVGDGVLRTEIEKQAADMGIKGNVIFTGARSDIPRLMSGAMDLFLFPSLTEGLGLVLVEAQAAGLPCVVSDVIPQEAILVSDLVQRLSLKSSAIEWARVIAAQLRIDRPVARTEAFKCVDVSEYNIERTMHRLTDIYRPL